ncbi:MAG: efflux transporter outer membrane subunit [Burkholderiales bacterium]|nr:efflux transporter outer membrane subunit [Burkholderiales bacterium]
MVSPYSKLALAWPVALSLAVTGGLGGCAALAPQASQQQADGAAITVSSELPASWSTPSADTASKITLSGSADIAAPASGATPQAAWWQHFHDPQLTHLIEQAQAANTSVATARAALLQARALRDVAQAGLGPTVGLSASAQRSRSGSGATAVSSSNYKAGADASWELDLFGANRSALYASSASLRASAANLGDVQVSIAAELALDYLTLRSAQARLVIADANLAAQLDTWQIAKWRLQAGLGSSLEAEQARAAAEQTQAQRPTLLISIAQSRHAIAVLTGRPPAALDAELAATAPLPQVDEAIALSLPADTLRQRADVRGAEEKVSAAVAELAQIDATRKPSFNLGGSIGLSALTLGSLTSGSSLVASILGSVSMPLFDGGAASARVAAQRAAVTQAQLAHRAAVLAALREVEDALAALAHNTERQAHLQQAAEAAANAALLARQRYQSGLIDFQTVLDTQRSQLGAEDSLASARADQGAAMVRLYKALGGGWVPAAELAELAGRPVDLAQQTTP